MSADLVYEAITALLGGGARRGQLSRGDRALCWVEAGCGEPVVVLGAGVGEPGSLAWAGVMSEVAAITRVVAYDRAGLGASDAVPELSLEQEVDDLSAVAAAVGHGPCVLVGHSWGGLLALLTALLHPHLVCGLVLVDPADEGYWQSLPPEAFREEEAFGRSLMEQHANGTLPATIRDMCQEFASTLTTDPAIQALFLDAYAACYATAPQASMFLREGQMSFTSIPKISAIRAARPLPHIPMSVLSATVGPPPNQRQEWTRVHATLAASAPGGTHTVMADTGHAIHQERPDEVAAAIAGVVEAVRGN